VVVPALRRLSTIRSLSSTVSESSRILDESLTERAAEMMERTKRQLPLTESEIDDVVNSIQNVCPRDYVIDYDALEKLLKEVAHLSHKDWSRTDANAGRLSRVLFGDAGKSSVGGGYSSDPRARQMLTRILTEGNWDGAVEYARGVNKNNNENMQQDRKPWAVLVTGVNGIRKTTSMYQPWFPRLLKEALAAPRPPAVAATSEDTPDPASIADLDDSLLPTGRISFFRQLDHMIATLCNEDFAILYRLTADAMKGDSSDGSENGEDDLSSVPPEVIRRYTDLKAAIFARYRTLSELLGASLLKEAQSSRINCLMETSGRDVAMFHYVDHFFSDGTEYNKLALHFQINALDQAKKSVDSRMVREIEAGIDAVRSGNVFDVIYANAGGPYGSEVLDGIRGESDAVWHDQVVSERATVGEDWYKATIQINASADDSRPWTAQAVRPDGSLGTEFEFVR